LGCFKNGLPGMTAGCIIIGIQISIDIPTVSPKNWKKARRGTVHG